MRPEQRLRGPVHGLGGQRHRDVPDAIALERRPRAAIEDAVPIGAGRSGEPGLEVVGDGLAGDHRHRLWPQMVVERLADAVGVPVPDEVEMRHLSQRMDAAIGAAGGLRDPPLPPRTP